MIFSSVFSVSSVADFLFWVIGVHRRLILVLVFPWRSWRLGGKKISVERGVLSAELMRELCVTRGCERARAQRSIADSTV